MDLSQLPVPSLLELYVDVMADLRKRGIVRSSNNPAGDYGELLFSKAFGWKLSSNSTADADAVSPEGVKYQIKVRRLTDENPSRQLSFIRRLPERPFDRLAAVLFDKRFRVFRAAIVPVEVVTAHAAYVSSVNAWRMILRDPIWDITGVEDVTSKLREAELLM